VSEGTDVNAIRQNKSELKEISQCSFTVDRARGMLGAEKESHSSKRRNRVKL